MPDERSITKVSVVIPLYNARGVIRETLESALGRTFRDLIWSGGGDVRSHQRNRACVVALAIHEHPRQRPVVETSRK